MAVPDLLIIMAMVYATGHLSGAHINPAVTIALTLRSQLVRGDCPANAAEVLVSESR